MPLDKDRRSWIVEGRRFSSEVVRRLAEGATFPFSLAFAEDSGLPRDRNHGSGAERAQICTSTAVDKFLQMAVEEARDGA
jgi:hypothetical protein